MPRPTQRSRRSNLSGFCVCVAFSKVASALRIAGWRVSRTAPAGLVLRALEQAVDQRRPGRDVGLICHSDRGAQYIAIPYTERLAEIGIEPSVGHVGDSYDNALVKTVIGLLKTGIINRRGPWRTFGAVEFATLEWVDWFNREHPRAALARSDMVA